MRTTLLLTGGLALGALVLLVHWGLRSGFAPLDRLGAEVAAVDATSLDKHFPVESLPIELRPIAILINELLSRLGASFARERRFTANVAHELRTPLAELRALAEVNLSTPATEDERAEAWQDALAIALRMESLGLRLVELARMENSTAALRREAVNLGEILRRAWQPCIPRAAERGILLEIDLPAGLVIGTDPLLLEIILGNLCANAAEHASADSTFRVATVEEAQAITLLFRNRVGDLNEADLSCLFERFWKKDAARADPRNHGLGLALAAETATLLGGKLSARLAGDDELEFALRLPRT